jgi:hypothetical protein
MSWLMDTINAVRSAVTDANQVPLPSSSPTPAVTTCGAFTNQGSPGPMAGGTLDVDTGLTVAPSTKPGGEPLYRRGTEIGRVTDFVYFNGYRVTKEVAVYVDKMIKDAAAEESPVILAVTSGFRTMEKQQELVNRYNAYQASENGTGPSAPKANYASAAGSSNHQGGIAVDFNVHHADGNYKWMVKNAWKYGFVRTCHFERWHWEYRGDWKIDGVEQKPEWAKHPKWGAGGLRQSSIFSHIPQNHIAGNPETGGGNTPIKPHNWWNVKRPTLARNHSDATLRGYTNSWIGPGSNESIPDILDRDFPDWKER